MKLILIEQRTPVWYALRKNSIGASDAAAILGESPWKTAMRLWEEKTGLVETEEVNSAAIQRGIDLEPEALSLFNSLMDINDFEPAIGQHQDFPWIIASFDGYSHSTGLHVEIKCPGMKDHHAAIDGNIPDKYRAQLHQQMLVSGKKKCFYFSYHPEAENRIALVHVNFDPEYGEKLMDALHKFHKCIETLTPPAPVISLDNVVDRSGSLEFMHYADEYLNNDRLAKHHSELALKAKERLIALSGGMPSKGGGVRITRMSIPGRVDYDSIVKEYDININKFRASGSETWRISSEKKKGGI